MVVIRYFVMLLRCFCCAVLIFNSMATNLAAQSESNLSGGQYVSESWDLENGLPIGHINQIYQTPNGYLWLATFSGLLRFDGVKFTRYDVSNTPELSSNRIIMIRPGRGNSFWLFTEQRNLVHVSDGIYKSYGPLLSIENQRLILDGDSVTWVTSIKGILRLEGDELVEGTIGQKNGLVIKSIFRRKDGDLIVIDEEGNFFLTRFPYKDLKKLNTPDLPSLPEAFLKDQKGEYWVTNSCLLKIRGETISVLNRDTLTTINWSGTPPLYYSINQDQNGELWILAETGLFGMKDDHLYAVSEGPKSESFRESAMRMGGGMSIAPDGSVWSVYQKSVYRNGVLEFKMEVSGNTIYCDSEGSIWITNSRFGIQRFSKALIKHYLMEDKPSNYYGVYQDKNGRIWFGTWSENVFYLTDSGKIKYVENSSEMGVTSTFGEDLNGHLYIGYIKSKSNFDESDLNKMKFARVRGLTNEIFAMHTSADSSKWFGTLQGVFLLKSDTAHQVSDGDTIPDFPVRYILETHGRNLWMATNGHGVRWYNYGTKENRYFTKRDGLSSDNIRSLYADPRGNIWVASEDRGLNRINPNTGEINYIGKMQGLYSESLNSLLLDNFNRLWIGTNEGIFWVDFGQLEAVADGEAAKVLSTVYTDRDGMLSRETNGGFQNSALKSVDGRLWFATQEGLVCVDPSKIMATEPLPKVVIEDFLVDGKSMKRLNGTIHLNRTTQNFRIEFTTPSYLAPNRIRFKYRLVGFDDKWIESGDRREANYTNIPGGNYAFQVVAFYDQSSSETDITQMDIHKEALIIETWWFWFLILIGLSLVIYGIFKWRLHQLKVKQSVLEREVHERTRDLAAEQQITETQKEKLEVLNREKSRFFANISHEFRTPITLIIGPLRDLLTTPQNQNLDAYQRNTIDVSLKNANRLMRLVEQLLEIAKLEAGKLKLNLEIAPLNDYIAEIVNSFIGLADAKKILFEIEIPEDHIFIEYDTEYLDKVVVNLLSNAFKFTPSGGRIRFEMESSNTSVQIHVSDTGKGIAPEHLPHLFDRFYQVEKSEMQPGTGIGLSITKEITELHHGEIGVKSTRGAGSVFTLSFPLAKLDKLELKIPHPENILIENEALPQEVPTSIVEDNTHFPSILEIDDSDRTTILIVDDNSDIRSYVSDSLCDKYKVMVAESGNSAFGMMEKNLPDVIISDVMMPDGDGLQLLQRIRADKAYSFLPVILLTAKAEIEYKLEGLQIGADDYITKPFDIHELKLRIKNMLQARKRFKSTFLKKQEHHSKINLEIETLESQDVVFLERVKTVILESFKEEDFTIESLAEALNQSRSNLYRKLMQLTNESPSALLKRIRLEQAAQLLKSNAGNVSEIAYSCGFNSVSHFSKSFSKVYGVPPTAYCDK